MASDDSKKEQDKKDVGQKSRNAPTPPRAGAPHFPEDEGVVQKAVHRGRGGSRRMEIVVAPTVSVSERSGIASISANAPQVRACSPWRWRNCGGKGKPFEDCIDEEVVEKGEKGKKAGVRGRVPCG